MFLLSVLVLQGMLHDYGNEHLTYSLLQAYGGYLDGADRNHGNDH